MKTIGFVDYFIDEWHSSNYIGWIDDLCKKNGYDFKVKYAWAEVDTYEGKKSTDEWCAEYGVEKLNSIEEICEKSDYLMILSPGNPEKHLKYAEEVLKYGKNTYIDKTFAPNLEEAKAIFALGEKYGTKFFSTSALRYAEELEEYKGSISNVIVRGGGRSIEEYIVHQIEMLVKLMGIGAKRVKVLRGGKQEICAIEYESGNCCFLEYANANQFGITVENGDGMGEMVEIKSEYFINLLDDILKFYENGVTPFENAQTLEVIAIRDAIMKAKENIDTWVEL